MRSSVDRESMRGPDKYIYIIEKKFNMTVLQEVSTCHYGSVVTHLSGNTKAAGSRQGTGRYIGCQRTLVVLCHWVLSPVAD